MANIKLSRNELLEDVRRLKSDIGRQTKVLKEMGLLAPSPAVSKWEQLEQEMPSDPESLSNKELRNYRRDLIYIKNLRTYSEEGYTSYQVRFTPIEESLHKLPKDKQDEFWKAYNKLYNDNPARGRKEYKYDLFMEIADRIKIGINPDKIVNDIIIEAREDEIRRRNEKKEGGVGRGTTIAHTRRTNAVRLPKTQRKKSSRRLPIPNDRQGENKNRKKRKKRRIHK